MTSSADKKPRPIVKIKNLTERTDPYWVRTTKLPLSGRNLGHVTKFRNFGTPLFL